MATIRSSAQSATNAVLGTVESTANVLISTLNGVEQATGALNIKAHELNEWASTSAATNREHRFQSMCHEKAVSLLEVFADQAQIVQPGQPFDRAAAYAKILDRIQQAYVGNSDLPFLTLADIFPSKEAASANIHSIAAE